MHLNTLAGRSYNDLTQVKRSALSLCFEMKGVNNFEYLTHLSTLAGRSYDDVKHISADGARFSPSCVSKLDHMTERWIQGSVLSQNQSKTFRGCIHSITFLQRLTERQSEREYR